MSKKAIFIQLFLIIFLLVPNQSALARTETFKVPHIKNDYCGNQMSAYNCKCAWHGQYCESVGMDQNTAAAYVTNAYNVWVEGLRASFKSACEQNGGLYGSDSCNYCDPGTIRMGAECKSEEDLCGADPNIKYNTGNKRCECNSGFDLMSDNTCEAKCNADDPFMFFDTVKNDCSCKQGYFLGDEGMCLGICGDDPNLLYNEANDECYCQKGFELEIEDDVYSCIELPDVDFNVEVVGGALPFIADAVSENQKFKVTLKKHDTDVGIPARFELKSQNPAIDTGSIMNVEEVGSGEYTFEYDIPDLTGNKIVKSSGTDIGLYVFYTSPTLGEELYKTFEIGLTTGVPVKITKPGFKEVISAVPFTSNNSKVKTVVMTAAGEKIPVYDSEISFSEFDFEKTNKDGEANMTAPTSVDGDKVSEIEIVMELSDEVKEYQRKTQKQYEQIVVGEKGITNPKVKDFVLNFEKYIAGVDMWEAEGAVIGLRRVGYTLLYMTEGKELAFDVAKEVAGSIKNQISDTLDLFEVKDKVNEKLKDKIDEKIKSVGVDKLEEKAIEKLKEAAPELNKKMDEMNGKFENGIVKIFKNAVKKYAPQFKQEWMDEIFGLFFSSPLEDYSTENLLDQGFDKVQNYTQDLIESKIKEYLVNEFDQMLQEGMKQLAVMIDNKSYNKNSFEGDVFVSKWESLDLRSTYLKAHEVSYNVSAIKDSADLFNNTFVEAAKITGLWKKQAEALEKGYKAIRSGVINNVEIYYWFTAYSEFSVEVKNNINRGIGSNVLTYDSQKAYEKFIDVFSTRNVFAEEGISQEDLGVYVDYKNAEAGLDFFKSALEVNAILADVFPEDSDIKETGEMLSTNVDEQATIAETLKDKALEVQAKIEEQKKQEIDQTEKAKEALTKADPGQYDLDGDGKITLNDFTVEEFIALGVILLIFLGVIYGIVKMIKRKPKASGKKKGKKKHNPFEEGLDEDGALNPFDE